MTPPLTTWLLSYVVLLGHVSTVVGAGEGEEVLELDEGDEREMQLGQGVAENGAADEVEEDANDDDDASEMSAA